MENYSNDSDRVTPMMYADAQAEISRLKGELVAQGAQIVAMRETIETLKGIIGNRHRR